MEKPPLTYYDQIAEGYEELHGKEQKKKLALIKEVLKKDYPNYCRKGLKLLDVACGTGVTSNFLEFEFEITGLDPAQKLLDKCTLPITKVKAVAEDMPLQDKQFDIVISVTALQNFYDLKKGLQEIKRVGKEDALFMLTFLKRSPKNQEITSIIQELFTVEQQVEEDKDLLFFCKK
jgi:ubiquinone/menaquinone biosynthesis C-methylase UbiE